eukprot:TRINITY_DN10769_c2_g1_i1.p1 TRINITY_DN10769_c2_g1~~TRINITY_DN10769_c2_g1_i1.p1  ORF type:complete len:233 (-),score=37.48 TRINITY_DN10769_c2_g1_i1:112-759(-)
MAATRMRCSALVFGLTFVSVIAVPGDDSVDQLPSVDGHSTVYIIRGGEKKGVLGCLSSQGQARAQNLVDVFSGKPSVKHDTFLAPKSIFANYYHDSMQCERCNQTVTPLSEALGVPIDMTHGAWPSDAGGGDKGAAVAIKEALRSAGGPVLVAWRRFKINSLAKELGVPSFTLPMWSLSDYDRVYVLEFDSAQNFQSVRISKEGFTLNVDEDVVV